MKQRDLSFESSSDESSGSDVGKDRAETRGRCHMLVARSAPQVVRSGAVYHRECFEAWYFGRHGRRPALLSGSNGDRHRFQVRDQAA